MSESIDQIVAETAGTKALPLGHHARAHAAELPEWHPVRRLFTGESQWLGENQAVYVFLRMFCLVYDDYIWPPAADAPSIDARAEFLRIFPNHVIFRGKRSKMHDLHAKARDSIEAATEESPSKRASGLAAFDRAFSDLVRAIKST
jgi:hypothetical protein